MRRTVAWSTGLVLATALLAGCTSDSATGDDAGGAGAGSAGMTTSAGSAVADDSATAPDQGLPPGVTVAALPDPADVGADLEKRAEVSITECAASEDGWAASGQAANGTDADRDYRITVFFTTAEGTTVDWAEAELTVPAGEVGTWAAAKSFNAPPELLCTLRGVG